MTATPKKYLYGKYENLYSFMNGDTGLRFSDLSHFSRIENELIKDNELYKIFEINPKNATFTINDHTINPNDVVGNIAIEFPVINCYCLCLSDKKNDLELYKRFKADVCLEICVDTLLHNLSDVPVKFPGTVIEHAEVIYYDKTESPPTTDPIALAFYKRNEFLPEAEYRIAIRFPMERKGFQTVCGKNVPFFIKGESMHMVISNDMKHLNNNYLIGVHRFE